MIAWSMSTLRHLLSLSFFSMIGESSYQFALVVELALITSNLYSHDVAAYAAVSSTTTFAINIFNFLLINTMAQIGFSVGQKSWHAIGPQFRVGIATAIVLGSISGVLLLLLEDCLFSFVFHLEPNVEAASRSIYKIRLLLIPLMMLQRVCAGLLGGYQRVKALAVKAVVVGMLEIISQVVALKYGFGIVGCTWGSVITAACGVVLSLLLVICYPPEEACNRISMLPLPSLCCWCNKNWEEILVPHQEENENENEIKTEDEDEDEDEDDDKETTSSISCSFASAAVNTTVRSFLLTSSVYSMSVAAANLGTASLAAHQIVMTLWMLMSLVCDGFADVGTMLGSKLIGEQGRIDEMRVLRDMLLFFGCVTGLMATTGMWLFRDDIINFYSMNNHTAIDIDIDIDTELDVITMTNTTADSVLAQLTVLWPLICGMQTVNAAVFVLDGFVYATQSFTFIRNLMMCAVFAWFVPSLLIGTTSEWFLPHTLLSIWIAKAGLNLLRLLGALWLMYVYYERKWRGESLVHRSLQDPLLDSSTG